MPARRRRVVGGQAMNGLLVVGDALVDRDVWGEATRLCPDAPVPVVDETVVIERPGGAGLAAVLATRLTDPVTLVTAIADDEPGRRLRHMLDAHGVEVIALTHSGTTVEKTRVGVDGRPLVRIDRGRPGLAGPLTPAARAAAQRAACVLVADYGGATLAGREVRCWLSEVVASGIPVVWDPHPRGAPPVEGTTLVTPNRAEARGFARALGSATSEPDGFERGGLAQVVEDARRLVASWRVGAVSVTLGADGALLCHGDGAPLAVPVDGGESGDTCGAGDAFAVAAAHALGRGSVLSEAVTEAVSGASAFVADGGPSSLAGASTSVRAPRPTRTAEQPRKPVVVASGGCFDVLHPGHVATLQHARRLGDRLVVLLNSDASVRRLKGPGRPVQSAEDRAAVLKALDCVDDVIVFDGDTPVAALEALRPEIFVKGGDYVATELPEAEVVARWGGAVVTVPYLGGRSTTQILMAGRSDG